MKLELSVKTTYLPTWKVWHGLRELIQNAKDAETELNAKMVVKHNGKNLIIENEGAVLPREALLFGHTTKEGNDNLIGKFGEGLKLGMLALVRGGFPVKIRSGCEVWTPIIEKSEKYDADVLSIDIQGGRKPEQRVSIEVSGLAKEIWDQFRWKFRFLDPNKGKSVETSAGALLLSPEMKGHIFVKGIYVSSDTKLRYGYDIKDVALDRDRKMIDPWDFRFKAKDILTAAAEQEPELAKGIIDVLENNTAEAPGFEVTGQYMPEKLAKVIAADFASKHGESAVPVKTLGESKDLDHLGKKGIVVPEGLAQVLHLNYPTVDKVRETLRMETEAQFGWHDLSDTERSSLLDASGLISNSGVLELSLDDVQVVKFKSPELRGLYKDGKVLIARQLVENPDHCLAVLIHEVAHKKGMDGAKSHVETIEQLWSGIVSFLRGQK